MQTNTPTLAQDLVNIHKVIYRAIDTDISNGMEYLKSGIPIDEDLQGYIKYNHCLMEVLHSHHQSEELIAFPAFRKVLPLAPYTQLVAEHQRMDTLTSLIPQVINDLSGDAPRYGMRVLVIVINKIKKIWIEHYKLEELYFSDETITASMNIELQQDIHQAVVQYRQTHSRPLYWVVPFLLYNLEPEDRSTMIGKHNPTATDESLFELWKDEWMSMKPFLLN